MKNILKSLFLIFLPYFSIAQVIDKEQLIYREIKCDIPIRKTLHPVSIPYEFKAPRGERNLNYSINYIADGVVLEGRTCSTWPAAAQTALEHAMEIWNDVLESTQNIGVDACWTVDVIGGTLGQAGSFFSLQNNLNGLPPTYYGTPVLEHITNQQIISNDIFSFFNANRTDWYFGTDAMPAANEVDFVSVALHELGHGLGFTGSAAIDDGVLDANNSHECDGIVGNGCIGFEDNGSFIPTIYDRFVDIDSEVEIISLTNPSTAIATNLEGGSTTGGSGGLDFDENNLSTYRDHGIELHAPANFQAGSSYSHFDETTLPNELMSPSFSVGQAIHDPGMAQIVMEEIGWSAVVVPVELSMFLAQKKNDYIELVWTTASEINSDYFEIQKSDNGSSFITIGKVQAAGNSSSTIEYAFIDRAPYAGHNYYRLKNVDFDGTYDFSKIELVDYEGTSREISIAPNPAYNSITVKSSEIPNGGKISIFTLDGRLVNALLLRKNGPIVKEIDISTLPKGNYYLQFQVNGKILTENFTKI